MAELHSGCCCLRRMRTIATGSVWGAGRGEGGTQAHLLQGAQSQMGAWLPQEGLGDHALHGGPCVFVPLSVPLLASKLVLKLF